MSVKYKTVVVMSMWKSVNDMVARFGKLAGRDCFGVLLLGGASAMRCCLLSFGHHEQSAEIHIIHWPCMDPVERWNEREET